MRDLFFNETGVRTLASNLRRVWPVFDEKGFIQTVLARLPALGLNERNYLIRDALQARMPSAFPRAAASG